MGPLGTFVVCLTCLLVGWFTGLDHGLRARDEVVEGLRVSEACEGRVLALDRKCTRTWEALAREGVAAQR